MHIYWEKLNGIVELTCVSPVKDLGYPSKCDAWTETGEQTFRKKATDVWLKSAREITSRQYCKWNVLISSDKLSVCNVAAGYIITVRRVIKTIAYPSGPLPFRELWRWWNSFRAFSPFPPWSHCPCLVEIILLMRRFEDGGRV